MALRIIERMIHDGRSNPRPRRARRLPQRTAGVAGLSLLLLARGPLAGAEQEMPRGVVVETVVCAADPSQSYALYLPTTFRPDRRWPTILVLDPRGRGAVAAELFRPAAERFGFVLLSSYGTQSDGPEGSDANRLALKALADELPRHAVDPARLYLAGFSGTARIAWAVAAGSQGGIAGVIGAGGALPGPFAEWKHVTFPFFGTAGVADFNHDELRTLDGLLDGVALPHRIEFFEGGHSWPPAALLEEALGWLETKAMQRGLRPVDPALAESLYKAGLAEARRREAAGNPFDARRRYQGLAEDFLGLLDTAEAAAGRRRLARDPLAAEQERALARAGREEATFRDVQLAAMARRLRESGDRPIAADRILSDLKVDRLARAAAEPTEAGRSARRRLVAAAVHLGFYLPRELDAAGLPLRAEAARKAAAEIQLAIEASQPPER